MRPPPEWLRRPGLAGGIDKSGERAGELLAMGFGSVEFGSVTALPLPGSNPGIAALCRQLAEVRGGNGGASATTIKTKAGPRVNGKKCPKTAIGISLGLPPELPAGALADEWLDGLAQLAEAPAVADYLSLNLSAAANRRFLDPALRPQLLSGLAAVAGFRRQQPMPEQPRLAVKLPAAAVPALWPDFVRAGVGQLTVVLGDGPERLEGLEAVCRLVAGQGLPVVAVGGIRSATDRQAALAAGANGVQVHRLFVAAGPATVALLLAAG